MSAGPVIASQLRHEEPRGGTITGSCTSEREMVRSCSFNLLFIIFLVLLESNKPTAVYLWQIAPRVFHILSLVVAEFFDEIGFCFRGADSHAKECEGAE